jgi:hypothetical protein
MINTLGVMLVIDPDRTIADLTEQYPGLIPVLAEIGFAGIRNPATRKSLGRMITLRKGCGIQGKSLGEVAAALLPAGFQISTDRSKTIS